MTTITQDMHYRLSLINYAEKYGVSKAAIKYKTNRQYIYRWKRRFDGFLESLRDRSRRPHHHLNQHSPSEIKLISDMRKRNPHDGLVIFWVKLMQRGYSRSISGLYRFLRRQNLLAVKPPNPKYVPKPYEQMLYPGQRIQIDVKFVPSVCLVNEAKGQHFYQFTAIDEVFPLALCGSFPGTQFLFFRPISGTPDQGFPLPYRMCPDRQRTGVYETVWPSWWFG